MIKIACCKTDGRLSKCANSIIIQGYLCLVPVQCTLKSVLAYRIYDPWRAYRHCDIQLSPSPHSMIFLCFLFYPVLSFATFSAAYLFFSISEDSNLIRFFSIAPASLRNVCPIRFHFLLFIWVSIGFCLVIFHNSSIVILSVHFIFIIRLKHLFINICSLLVIWLVVFQISQVCNTLWMNAFI